jgi:hypothetical protein
VGVQLALILLLAAAVAWLGWNNATQARELEALRGQVVELDQACFVQELQIDALQVRSDALWARQDRLQAMVVDRGWGDSLDFTRFNWARPPKF